MTYTLNIKYVSTRLSLKFKFVSVINKAMATRIKSSSVSTIFFDLDNTLIPTRKADKLACNKISEILRERYSISLATTSQICNAFLKSFRKCPENINMGLEEWRHLLWVQSLGDDHCHLADVIYRKWLQLRFAYLAITPEIKLLLNKLHQTYLLGLITNGTSKAQWEKINRLQLREYFDVILVSGDLPCEKPDKMIFKEACNLLDVKPQQCLMVGDKLETDILGGAQAKLGGTIWIPLNGASFEFSQCRPDYIIQSVHDLISLLPKSVTVPAFRRNIDLEDSNSNSSDGS